MVLLCAMLTTPSVSAAEVNTALLSYVAGDVNGDWSVTTADVREVLLSVLYETETPKAADVNGDGVVDTSDASYVLKIAVGNQDGMLVNPTATFIETAPEGEEIAFVQANADMQFADDRLYKGDVWIAQSLDELKATYTYSNGYVDYSANYTEEFFEDKAVIVWASHHYEDGLVNMEMSRIVRNGNELCLVRHIELFLRMPSEWFDRYILEVSKDDLVGVDTIRLCTEYSYREY